MKATDLVAHYLKRISIDTVFGVTGGAVVHLFDSAYKFGIRCIFTHHEQSAAFAAQAYARINGIGAAFFTTGPGGTNALTGIAAAWLDSIPTIYIAGQVRREHIKPNGIRQQGAQELDVLSMVAPIVKYATRVATPEELQQELEKCFTIATEGRPGPVFLEIPVDIQWEEVSENEASFLSKASEQLLEDELIQPILTELQTARRPLLLLGHGIRLAHAEEAVKELINKLQIPFVTTWNAADIITEGGYLNLGRPGMFGSRVANLVVQMCDFLCCIGTHLPIPVTTGNYQNFGKSAKIAIVNIDSEELSFQRKAPNYAIHADAKIFLQSCLNYGIENLSIHLWKNKCVFIKKKYSFQGELHTTNDFITSYDVVDLINQLSEKNDVIVVDGGGTIVQVASQTLELKQGQRFIIDAGLCSMGSGLPNAIGVAFSKQNRQVLCLCGDGSLQFNIQELQTIVHHNLPIKIFILNNQGYLSIRHTQASFLEGKYIGSSEAQGISIPDIQSIANAYNIPFVSITAQSEMYDGIKQTLLSSGPMLCEITTSKEQEINPRIGFEELQPGKFQARPMEDMYPFLLRDELHELFETNEASILLSTSR